MKRGNNPIKTPAHTHLTPTSEESLCVRHIQQSEKHKSHHTINQAILLNNHNNTESNL